MKMKKRDTGSLPLFQPSPMAGEAMPAFDYDAKTVPDYRFENWLSAAGYKNIAGTDEAGRGPLAGPVVAAAVILPLGTLIDGLNDSKKLSIKKRDDLFDQIMEIALSVSVCAISAETIDRTNIRLASLEAMRRSVATLSIKADALLVDGRDVPSGLPASLHAAALIKGDGRSMSIAAAAIIAKVSRDRMMENLGAENADYLLEKHMGYGSLYHRNQISQLGGIIRVHRFSFRPLRQDD